MGITGLLPLLKSIHKPTHLKNFSGQTLGVDAYGWLHRGTIACAVELAQGKPTRKHIDFALHRVRMLIHFGVKPYLVFDGDYLPSKAHTEKERAVRRKESKRIGMDLLRMGRAAQAHQELQKAIDVTPTMARELIEELKLLDVPYVVAPFEADSQLAYLEKAGIINGVISEDSDLLVFGVKCLLTKLDGYGECVMVSRDRFTACREVSLVGWTDSEFRMMAMLSGCDYLPGIDKMGLKTAYRLVRKHKTLDKVIRILQFDGKMKIPAGYAEAFTNAERTFLYQWVFCPETRRLRHLTPLPDGLTAASMPFLGQEVDPEVAAGVAAGDLDPNTKQPIVLPQRYANRAVEHRVVSTPIEKCGKPITEFFKRRTPLAELDPNSFTPSPSQQRLLQSQTGASWSASYVENARLSLPASLAGDVPSSAPQPARSSRLSMQIHRDPPKRPRLCSDPAIAEAMTGAAEPAASVSRFFATPTSQASPSLRRTSHRTKSDEFDLWSDDSVAEAVAAATSTPEFMASNTTTSRKRKKLAVFIDEKPVASGLDSQPSEKSLPTDSSTEVSQADTAATLSEDSQHVSFAASLKTFKSVESASEETPFDIEVTPLRSSTAATLVEASPGAAPNADTAERVEPAGHEDLPIARTPTRKDAELCVARGSEDFLVPNSPQLDEDDQYDGRTKPRLNLGRFMFSG